MKDSEQRAQGAFFDGKALLIGIETFSKRPGGLSRYVEQLAAALSEQGVKASVVPLESDYLNVSFWNFRAARLIGLLRNLLRVRATVLRLAETSSVIDSHFALGAFLPVHSRRLKHLPLVVHFQGPWADESRLVGGNRLTHALKRAVEFSVYRRANEIIVLSRAFKQILIERYCVPPWRVSVIPPGVDLKKFVPASPSRARAELGISKNDWVALSVRRLIPRTGVSDLLHAWARFKGLSSRNSLLFIAGEGPSRSELELLAKQLRILDSVRFLGRLDDRGLIRYFQAADVSVVPSSDLEGFGLVVLESLACGTPVIGTDSWGLREALQLAPSLVVEARNVPALADCIRETSEGMREVPSRTECRAYAEKHGWVEVAAVTRAIYEKASNPGSARKLRAVFLDHCARYSGGELALLRLLPTLDGLDAHVILGEEGPLVADFRSHGISLEVLRFPRVAREVSKDALTYRRLPLAEVIQSLYYICKLARRLRRYKPDLVVTNSLKSAIYGGIAAKAASIPVVWHMRDRIATDYLPAAAVRLVRTLAKRIPDAVIANSEATLRTISPSHFRAVIPSAVVGDVVPALAGERCPGPPNVGIVGRIAPWKGQHIFLQAFAAAFKGTQVHATVLGAPLFGEEAYERELHKLAEDLEISDQVVFKGFSHHVPEELARLSILVHSSLTPEPFGQVIVEGMAAGLPVVATEGGGPSEIIENGVDGLLYRAGDVQSLAMLLKRLADDQDLRARLGEAARRRAAHFTPEVIGPKVMGVYRQVIAARMP